MRNVDQIIRKRLDNFINFLVAKSRNLGEVKRKYGENVEGFIEALSAELANPQPTKVSKSKATKPKVDESTDEESTDETEGGEA